MNKEKLQEVFSDEVFVKSLLALETPEEVQVLLKTKDVELSVEEIIKVKDLMASKMASGEELSDEDLDNVAGGFFLTLIASLIPAIIGLTAGGISAGTQGKW